MRLNPVARRVLADAVAMDHPCDDYDCDISTALLHGFVLSAAYLLMGATETPSVDAVVSKYSLVIPGVHSREFGKWVLFHRKYGRKCQSCESYMYANPETGFEPATCTNCGGSSLEEAEKW